MAMSVILFISSFFVFLDLGLISWVVPVFLLGLSCSLFDGYFDGFMYSDNLSFLLGFLTFWVFVVCFICSEKVNFSYLSVWLMLVGLFFSFYTDNYLVFYVSFEFVFVVMFVFLLGWGKSAERFQASFYMLFYTMVFSLPFLVLLVFCYLSSGASSFFSLGVPVDSWLWVFMFMVFIVKLPLYGVHLWLPKAHVEAPVVGSMILAGVLLKLGGYGVLRFICVVEDFGFSSSYFLNFLFYLSLYGGLLVSLLCARQMDLKMLIAYSSVVHMSVMFLGILSFSSWGLYGALLMMVSHGFISPLMFFLMTYLYEINHSRSVMVLKGALLSVPVFCLFWFLCCSLNLSVPPFMSFYGEVCIVGSLGCFSFLDFIIISLCCFFTGVYCIFSYVMPTHGAPVFSFFSLLDFKTYLLSVCYLFFVLVFPLVFFI